MSWQLSHKQFFPVTEPFAIPQNQIQCQLYRVTVRLSDTLLGQYFLSCIIINRGSFFHLYCRIAKAGKRFGKWPLCVIASDVQISQPSLVWKQNSSHLHSLCVGILFNCTALGIHLCKTSQLYILKTRLGGEIYSSDVNMHKGYCINSPIYYIGLFMQ